MTRTDPLVAMDDRIQSLIADNERLRDALAPFAMAAAHLVRTHQDSADIWHDTVGMWITAGDLRRAALSHKDMSRG